jgi:hypothetical protein
MRLNNRLRDLEKRIEQTESVHRYISDPAHLEDCIDEAKWMLLSSFAKEDHKAGGEGVRDFERVLTGCAPSTARLVREIIALQEFSFPEWRENVTPRTKKVSAAERKAFEAYVDRARARDNQRRRAEPREARKIEPADLGTHMDRREL